MNTTQQAIYILAVCACGWESTVSAAKWLGASKEARELAYRAWVLARKRVKRGDPRMVYAEAQCLVIESL